jgi:hypothetical protein
MNLERQGEQRYKMEQKKNKDYPYQFLPQKTLTTKELTELLTLFFSIKSFPVEFIEAIPEKYREHFQKREDLAKFATIERLVKNVTDKK